jgi:PIN domain nuclease of toxin-antitoxin system
MLQAADAVYISAASLWEIATKAGLGKIQVDVSELLQQLHLAGFQELPVTWQHTLKVGSLPNHHKDPFDRILIAQAISEPLRFLTANAQLPAYSSDLVTLL